MYYIYLHICTCIHIHYILDQCTINAASGQNVNARARKGISFTSPFYGNVGHGLSAGGFAAISLGKCFDCIFINYISHNDQWRTGEKKKRHKN